MRPYNKKSIRNAKAKAQKMHDTNPNLFNLIHAIDKNNITQVKKLLKRNSSLVLEPMDHLGSTVLAYAVAQGRKAIVDYLLDNYPSHNFKQVCNEKNDCLLHLAVRHGHTQIAKRLLEEKESGLDVNQANNYDKTLLAEAVYSKRIEMVKLLLAHKAIIKTDDLFTCCVFNHIEIASLLLNNMENKSEIINQKSQQHKGLSPFAFAIQNTNVEFIRLLIEHGAIINSLLKDGETFLIRAVCQESVDKVELLLNLNQIDINAQCTTNGATALMEAAGRGNHAIVKLLLEKGADPNLKTKIDNQTALTIAVSKGHIKIAAMLIANKHWNPDIINPLLDGKDICQKYPSAFLIHLFIKYYDHNISKDDRLLIKNICRKCTKSQLIIDDLVLKLMENENSFYTLLDSYISYTSPGHSIPEIKLDTIKPNGKPLLSYAIEQGNMKIFTTLCQYTNNIDQKDPSGLTPLAYAAKSGSCLMFKTLLRKDPNLNEKDLSGRSILSYAIEGLNNSATDIATGSKVIVQSLLNHDRHNVSTAELTDTEYIQLLDFIVQRNVEWLPKLKIFNRCISQINKDAHLCAILNMLSKKNDKSHLQQVDQTGRTLLSHFAQTGNLALVTALMEQYTHTNINMDQADDMGRTPLLYALQKDDINIIDILLKNGADVNHVDKQTYTPLLYAIERKSSMAVIKKLLEYKVDFSCCDGKNHGALWHAINKDYLSVVDELLPQMIKDPKCHTELCVASFLAESKNKKDLCIKLIDAIAPLFEQDHSQEWVKKRLKKSKNHKPVVYSAHAKQRAKERSIEYNTINQVIQNYHTMQESKQSNNILKLMDDNICVIIAKQENTTTVITTYRINA